MRIYLKTGARERRFVYQNLRALRFRSGFYFNRWRINFERRERRCYGWVSVLFFLATWVPSLSHDGRALTVDEVALFKGPDRQKVLEEGAKKEGKLLWYSTLIVNQALRPIKEAFEKRYPFVQIEYYRADSDQLAQKMIAEYQAKRFDVDVLDGTSTIVLIKKAGYLQRFFSPQLNDYPANLKGADGYWAVPNVYFMTLGYNTKLVKPNEVPGSLNDLLNPRWKGKMIWSTSGGSGAPIFIGNTLMTMGEEKGYGLLAELGQAGCCQDYGQQ